MAQKQKSSKAGRKKKSPQNLRYVNERRHAKSHVRRITKHLARYGDADKVSQAALTKYKYEAGILSAKPA